MVKAIIVNEKVGFTCCETKETGGGMIFTDAHANVVMVRCMAPSLCRRVDARLGTGARLRTDLSEGRMSAIGTSRLSGRISAVDCRAPIELWF